MTKEEYLLLTKNPEIPMELWFEYYREMGGYLDDIKTFEQIFLSMTQNQAIVQGKDGSVKQITLNSARNNLQSYYAKKFNL